MKLGLMLGISRHIRGISIGGIGFLPPITENLLPNGTFDTSAGWTLGAGCTVVAGKLWCNNNTANATNDYPITLPAGTYKVTYTISEYVHGQVIARINQGSLLSGTSNFANGTYTDTFVCANTITSFEIRATRTSLLMDYKVDDITIVRLA